MNLLVLISKVVGQPEASFWSQVHNFVPQEPEKREKYGSLFLAIAISKKTASELDLNSYGKEVLQRFHETYFSSQEEKTVLRLQEAINKLEEEFFQELSFDLVSAIILGERLYLARNGQARVYVQRGEEKTLIFASEKETIASGRLKVNDSLVLGTGSFFKSVPLKILEEILSGGPVSAGEKLAGQIFGSEENSQVAALIIKVTGIDTASETKPADTIVEIPENPKDLLLSPPRVKFEKIRNAFYFLSRKFARFFPSSRELYLQRQKGIFEKKKKYYFFMALFLIALLFLSIFLQGKRGSFKVQNKTLEKAEALYSEAESFSSLNPLRSKELLDEADALLQENKEKEGELLSEKIRNLKETVSKEYKIESAQVFQDLTLLREGTKGKDLGLYEDNLLIFDKDEGVVLSFDIKTKAGKILAAGLKEADFIGQTETWGFAVSQKKIFGAELTSDKWKELKTKDWQEVVDVLGFSGSLYLLDRKAEILKYVVLDKGLADKKNYLKSKADFSESVSFAIDGSVWVMDKNGQVSKFTQGEIDSFTIMGLDKPFNQPETLYTNENLDNLYILDKNNTRVVVIAKSGEYQAQYVWGGIAGVDDLVVSEELGKILLLAREKIYEITLK